MTTRPAPRPPGAPARPPMSETRQRVERVERQVEDAAIPFARMSDFNQQIIDEFRANDGKVGGNFEGAPLLLLHTIGAKSGAERVNPMVYLDVDGSIAVFASKAGADTNPDWYHNLLAHPEVSIEIGTETRAVTARIAEGDERDTIWTQQKQVMPGFADYEANTDRVIPVVILEDR